MQPLLQNLMQKTREIILNIQLHLQTKRKINPFTLKLLALLEELERFVSRLSRRLQMPGEDVREELSVIYRAAEEIDEMFRMVQRTESMNITLQIGAIKQTLSDMVPFVVQLFGEQPSLYIITPSFQRLAKLWR